MTIADEARRVVADFLPPNCIQSEAGRDYIERAVTAFGERQKEAGRAEAMAWRKIGEYHVGRDGHVVLTCDTPGSQRGFRLSYWDRTIERWRTVGSADWTHPTHFMPLPAPPAPQAATEKETERG